MRIGRRRTETDPGDGVVVELAGRSARLRDEPEVVQERERARLPLTVVGVSGGYDGVDVVHDVAFEAQPGDILAITGPSGAGKSTLLWTLMGAQGASGGRVQVGAQRIGSHADALEAGVRLMPQGNALAATLTAAENIVLPLLATGVEPAQAEARAAQSLDAVGLGDSGDHLVEELSGGQQQRAAAARLLAASADVLLADEPTSDLDAVNRARIMALLRAEARAGAVVVVTTHDPEAAAEADAEIHLDEGRMTWVRGRERAEREEGVPAQ
ncbi:ATP-binding cassette domain-containing protein [Luteipulveratus flavus]|uniref:ATP-binding cassette domain-containing protein n=1 Tax=Luteipulveratus flavus TaxID=3031728 RepID=A0ABT6C812_9MICO|nr:ATP-binding cassette domain-containing protein [Luteipulveratus sp. YIM 133296]MDF8264925.1 ATP-binding cassette domain-containing protein [Luteipulveratus sp. YIM 133296]